MRERLLAACVLVAASATPALAGPTQVRITLGGYGQSSGSGPQPTAALPSAPPQSISPVAAAVIGAEVAIAQASAYQRYLQYVAAAQGGRVDPSQYFTNGAAALTLPSTGAASSYFTNGAEATRVPGPAPAASSAAPPPPPPPPVVAAQSPAPAPPPPAPAGLPLPPPYWWVEGQTRSDVEPAPAPLPAVAVPPAAAPDDAPPAETMSFEDWLRTMDQGGSATSPALAAADDEAPLEVAEPAAAVLDIRPRKLPVGRDPGWRRKGRADAPVLEGPGALAVPLAVTFLAGLLVGAVSMRRLRSKPA